MANSLIPYSFVPGTKAMASEVNANFIALAQSVDEGRTFTTESIEEFNNTLEERLDESLGNKLETNLSNSSNITDGILESPQMVDITLESGTLTLKAGSKVIIPYGTSEPELSIGDTLNAGTNEIGTIADISWKGGKLFYIVELSSDILNGSFNATGKRILIPCFYVSGNFILGGYTVGNYFSGETAPSLTNSAAVWYDTANNIIKRTTNTGSTWSNLSSEVYALPCVIATSSAASTFSSIDEVFQNVGYIGTYGWVNKGLKLLIPDGRNDDGTLKNIEITTDKVITQALGDGSTSYYLLFFKNQSWRNAGVTTHFIQDEQPTVSSDYATWYSPQENIYRITNNAGSTWTISNAAIIERYSTLSGEIQEFNAYGAVELMKRGDIQKVWSYNVKMTTSLRPAVVVETYKSDSNWYRIWSDGWIEQGGRGSGTYSKTFLKPFKDTNYMLSVTPLCTDGSADNCMVKTITATGFTAFVESNNSGFWYACGY